LGGEGQAPVASFYLVDVAWYLSGMEIKLGGSIMASARLRKKQAQEAQEAARLGAISSGRLFARVFRRFESAPAGPLQEGFSGPGQGTKAGFLLNSLKTGYFAENRPGTTCCMFSP